MPGCAEEHHQSVLHPAGPAAETIEWLWWLLFWVCAVVLVVVTVLTLWAIVAKPRARTGEPQLGNGFIVISGIILPSVILVVLLIFSLQANLRLRIPETQLTVRVIGHQFWWEIHYPDHQIITANEIHIPVGVPVKLELRAADVIHSFWVPHLHGKMDLLPEHTNFFWFQADKAGVYRGQCAEFCGVQHALMAFNVVAMEPLEFERWLEAQKHPPPPPMDEVLQRGQRAFFVHGCNTCHAIAGTEADARIGPDLTRIGSRLTIGAGTRVNNYANLSGWVANPQPIKPGNLMPPSFIPPEEFHALIEYLVSLR
jgi:cytochrome c oxidase subunit II